MGWLGVYHTCLSILASFFWGKETHWGNDLTFIISRWSCKWAFLCCCCRSSWLCLKRRRSARKPMLLWNRKLPNLQSYHQNPNLWCLGRSFSIPNHCFFFSRKWLRIKNWLNVETSEQSQEQTNLSTVQPASPPTFQPSNLIQVLILLYKALYISSLGWYLIMDQKDERIFIRYCQSWNSVFTSSLPKSAYVESNRVFHWLKYGVCLDIAHRIPGRKLMLHLA